MARPHVTRGVMLTAALLAALLAAPAPVWADETPAGSQAVAGEQAASGADGQAQGPSEDAPAADAAQADGADEEDSTAKDQASTVTPAVVKKVRASVSFVGTDGTWADVRDLTLDEGATAWDATRLALTKADLEYRTGTLSAQDVIVSVTRTDDGVSEEFDSSTGSGWHLYLNGERYLGSASSIELADGDALVWQYEVGTFMVSVSVVGPGGTGDSYWIAPTSVRMEATQTVWDASLAVFEQNGYGGGRFLSYVTGTDGSIYLDSLATLGENGITGESWQAFVNGALPETDVAHVALHAGDSICWYYTGRGVTALPAFVAETGAASQNPAASVRIEGLVTQAWVSPSQEREGLFAVLDCVSGLAISGQNEAVSLVGEGVALIDPLSQSLGDGGWRASLAHVLDDRLTTGEGVRSVMGRGGSLYYLDGANTLVKLELQ